MEKWQNEYKRKLTTAKEAVKCIESDNRVILGHAAGEPLHLVDAMVSRHKELRNVEIFHMVSMGKCEYVDPEYANSFRHNGQFLGSKSRIAYAEGRVDFTPLSLSDVPACVRKGGTLEPDVTMLQVTPPDDNGNCSYGISYDYTVEATKNAKYVIAQVNKMMPRTFGPTISVDDIDFFVEHDEPIIVKEPIKITETEMAIGEHVAGLIPDNATLQLGIGGIPDAILHFLKDKKDLGIHSEMFSDGVVDLYNEGVITNKKKTLHQGKFVVTFLMGTKKLYDFVDNNEEVLLLPGDYTNDPYIIGENYLMHAINSALQIDLLGQIDADNIGPKQFSGAGGQLDFMRGAVRSKGGKSIIALPSTAAKGTKSRIVLKFDEFSAATDTRLDCRYVITEYGIAQLWGKTVRQRARELINIAHPDFREELEEGARKNYWL